MKHSSKMKWFKAAALLVALAFPAFAGVAAAGDVVSTRTDEPTAQQSGRDSVYALNPAPVYSPAKVEPQRYGRAGGYVGTDRVEAAKQRAPEAAAARSDVGQSGGGRMSGDRFDHADSAHGQNENTVQSR